MCKIETAEENVLERQPLYKKWMNINTVSYTHLDVYKRQLPTHSMDSRCSIVLVIPLIFPPVNF